jgi:hypothetical protein
MLDGNPVTEAGLAALRRSRFRTRGLTTGWFRRA